MSPFTVDHGVLGLEGIHRIANLVDLNDLGAPLPRIELDRITGLHSLSDADDNREPTYAQGGEQVYRSLRRGRTITYEGRVVARNLLDLRALVHDLRYAASSGYLEGTTDFVVRPGSFGGVVHRYTGRVIALDVDDEQALGYSAMPSPFQREFVMSVRQADSRYYLVGADVTAGTTTGSTVTVHHPGNAPAQPVFIVNGPIASTLTFHRLDNFVERKLVYVGIGIAAGQALRLDFATRTLRRVSDDESFEQFRVYDDSNWWDAGAAGINPGDTQVKVTGGTTWTITFAPANW